MVSLLPNTASFFPWSDRYTSFIFPATSFIFEKCLPNMPLSNHSQSGLLSVKNSVSWNRWLVQFVTQTILQCSSSRHQTYCGVQKCFMRLPVCLGPSLTRAFSRQAVLLFYQQRQSSRVNPHSAPLLHLLILFFYDLIFIINKHAYKNTQYNTL